MQIGVVITTHERPALVLERALVSARTSRRPTHIIVVNDGELDLAINHLEVLRTPAPHSGPASGRNIGTARLKELGCTHVVCLDDDDWLTAYWDDYYHMCYNHFAPFSRHPDRVVIDTVYKMEEEDWSERILEADTALWEHQAWSTPQVFPARGREGKLSKMVTGAESMTVTACCPIRLWEETGGWPSGIHVEDHLFWMRVLAIASGLARLPEAWPVLHYSQRRGAGGQRTDEMADGDAYWDSMILNSEEIVSMLSTEEIGGAITTFYSRDILARGKSLAFLRTLIHGRL